MKPMKGAGALASAVLVLAGVSATPAVSAAQDADVPADPPASEQPDPADTGPSPGKAPSTDPADPVPAATGSETAPESGSAPATSSPSVTFSSAGGEAHASASATVTMGDFFFSPSSVTVAVGDAVTWRNTGQAPHNATADDGSFKTPDLSNGGSASHTFSRAGTFTYICTIHPNMHGTVRVLSSNTGGSGGGGSAGSSSGGSSQSEASAVASPSAAGTSTSLPSTGLAAGALALAGLAMLAGGIALRRLDRDARGALRFLTLY
jgi:plastocyanin